jgi:dephospho-CoA kinase
VSSEIFRVALTGGIASGKTTVANMFGELGAALIDTDIIARDVVEPGTPGLEQVVAEFGANVIDDNGRLDRRALRNIVFSDENKRLLLEEILHPLIRAETERQMCTLDGPYQLLIVPLLVESPLKDHADRILVVDCSEERQLERLLSRDVETEAQARRMIAAQSSREDRLALADDVIINDADIESTRKQVADTHQSYLSFAAA